MDSNLEMLVECEHCGNSIELLRNERGSQVFAKVSTLVPLTGMRCRKKYPHFTQMVDTTSGKLT